MQQQPFEWTEETAPDHLVAPDNERPARREAEVFSRDVVADELDVARIRDTEAAFVRHPQEGDGQRIETHQPRSDGVDRDRVRCREQHVRHTRDHRPRARAIPGDRPVHRRENRRMELLLHVQEINEDFVHVLVRVMPDFAEQAAERVLDGSGHDRMAVRLHGGQVKNLPSRIHRRNLDALGKNVIQLEEWTLERVHAPFDFRQRCKGEPMPFENRFPPIVPASLPRLGDDGLVFDWDEPRRIEPVGQHLRHDAVDLPGLGRARRKILRPGEVQFQQRVAVPRQDVAVAGKIHHAGVVVDDGFRPGANDRHARSRPARVSGGCLRSVEDDRHYRPRGEYINSTIVTAHNATHASSGGSVASIAAGLPPPRFWCTR